MGDEAAGQGRERHRAGDAMQRAAQVQVQVDGGRRIGSRKASAKRRLGARGREEAGGPRQARRGADTRRRRTTAASERYACPTNSDHARTFTYLGDAARRLVEVQLRRLSNDDDNSAAMRRCGDAARQWSDPGNGRAPGAGAERCADGVRAAVAAKV